MVLKSGFSQANFSATLLRGAAIAIALLVPASPARSETIDLTCASTESSSNVRIQIDTEQRTVLETWATGTAQFRTTMISRRKKGPGSIYFRGGKQFEPDPLEQS
jgi:hypothetical protein